MKALIAILVIVGAGLLGVLLLGGAGGADYLESGRDALKSGRFAEATELLAVALARGGAPLEVHLDLAEAHRALGRDQAAFRAVRPLFDAPDEDLASRAIRLGLALQPAADQLAELEPIVRSRGASPRANAQALLALAEFEQLHSQHLHRELQQEVLRARREGAPPSIEIIGERETLATGRGARQALQTLESAIGSERAQAVSQLLNDATEASSRALEALDRAAALTPEDTPTRLLHATALLDRDRHAELERILAPLLVLPTDPPTPAQLKAWKILGASLARRGEQAQLIEKLGAVAALSPEAERELWPLLARAHYGLGQGGPLLAMARRQGTANENEVWPQFFLGAGLLLEGKAAEALPHLRRAQSLGGDEPTFLFLLAKALIANDRPEQATGLFELSCMLRPDDHALRVEAAGIMLKAGLRSEAQDILRAAIPRDLSNTAAGLPPPLVREALAALYRSGLPAMETREATEAVRSNDPFNPLPRLRLAQIALRESRPSLAEDMVLAATDEYSWLPEAWIVAAEVAVVRESYETARQRIEEALRLEPDSLPAQRLAIEIGRRQEQPDRALRDLERYLAAQPGDVWAQRMRAHLLLANGRTKDAVQWTRQLVRDRALDDDHWPLYVSLELSYGDVLECVRIFEELNDARNLTPAEEIELARLEWRGGKPDAAALRLRELWTAESLALSKRLEAGSLLFAVGQADAKDHAIAAQLAARADIEPANRARALELSLTRIPNQNVHRALERLVALRDLDPQAADRVAVILLAGPLLDTNLAWQRGKDIALDRIPAPAVEVLAEGARRQGTAAELERFAARVDTLGGKFRALSHELRYRAAQRQGEAEAAFRHFRAFEEDHPLEASVVRFDEAIRAGRHAEVLLRSKTGRFTRTTNKLIARQALRAALAISDEKELRTFIGLAHAQWPNDPELRRGQAVVHVLDNQIHKAAALVELGSDDLLENALANACAGMSMGQPELGTLSAYAARLQDEDVAARRLALSSLGSFVPSCIHTDLVRIQRGLGEREDSAARWRQALCLVELARVLPLFEDSALGSLNKLRNEAGLASGPIRNVQAWARIHLGKPGPALRELREHLKEESPSPTVVTLSALALLASGSPGNIEDLVNGTLGAGALSGRIVIDLVHALLDAGEPKLAQNFIARVPFSGRDTVLLRIRAELEAGRAVMAASLAFGLDPRPEEPVSLRLLRAQGESDATKRKQAFLRIAEASDATPVERIAALVGAGQRAQAIALGHAQFDARPQLDNLEAIAARLAGLKPPPKFVSNARRLLAWIDPARMSF